MKQSIKNINNRKKYRDYSLYKDDLVRVYKNLTKDTYSIQTKIDNTWRVIGHSNEIFLTNVEFKVSEKTRVKVVYEQKKYVHAYVYGNIQPKPFDINSTPFTSCKLRVYYNPYKTKNFVNRNIWTDTTSIEFSTHPLFKISKATHCILNETGVYITPERLSLNHICISSNGSISGNLALLFRGCFKQEINNNNELQQALLTTLDNKNNFDFDSEYSCLYAYPIDIQSLNILINAFNQLLT